MEELITFKSVEADIFSIECKKIGKIGDLVFMTKFNMWCLLPIENFFYKPIHVALILKQLNNLNGYDKKKEEEKNDL